MIIDNIRTQIKQLMREKDAEKLGLLRLVVGTAQQDGNETDAAVEAIIRKMIKSNNQTIAALKENGSSIDDLNNENELLELFLPKSMSVQDIKAFVVENNIDLASQSSIGAKVGVLMKALKGKNVQGGDVKKAIEELSV